MDNENGNVIVDLFPEVGDPLEKSLNPELPDRSIRPSISLTAPFLHSEQNTPFEKMFEVSDEITPEWMKSFEKEIRDPFLGRRQQTTSAPAKKVEPGDFAKSSQARLAKCYAKIHGLFGASGNDEMLEGMKETCREILEHERAAVLVASTKED
jgi:hypothetical protein